MTAAQFIIEVYYSTWLSNVVMVKKLNGKWRKCMDYTNLNRACSKDVYPLLNIDHLVDGATEHRMLSFLDGYSGYNQIRMDPMDEEKTTFITKSVNFCYKVVSFRLKKHQSNISMFGGQSVPASTWKKPRSLRRQHGSQI